MRRKQWLGMVFGLAIAALVFFAGGEANAESGCHRGGTGGSTGPVVSVDSPRR